MIFGKNPQSALLLAVVGLREHDVDRFRDISVSEDGTKLLVYTRTGGGNRPDYPNVAMRKRKEWLSSVDDDFDSTYCTDDLSIPERWRTDVAALSDPFSFGIRKSFAKHLAKTLNREPTEADKKQAAHDSERAELARTRHVMANGHTFVPYDDSAMETALRLAEANGGELRSCWGILPLALSVHTNRDRYGSFARFAVDSRWDTDPIYLAHCVAKFSEKYPVAMAKVVEGSRKYAKVAP